MRNTQNLEERFLSILLIIALVGLIWLFSPFVEALLFAMILATATYSIYERVLSKVKGSETLASSLTSLAMFFIVIAPVTYLLLEVGLQVGHLYGQAQDWLSIQTPESFKDLNKQIVEVFPIPETTQGQLLSQLQENSSKIIKFAQNSIVYLVQGVFGSTASFLTFMLLSVFALYFFYRDGKKISRYLMVLSPLDNFYDKMIMNRFTNLSTILLLSVLGIAVMQGVSFAILAWFLGLPGLFLGMAIAVTSFIPIIGSALVWIPVSIILSSQGDHVSAMIVAFMGVVINGFIIDNILRPVLINKISQTLEGAKDSLSIVNHTLVTVLSTFAGLIHFGIIGLFFGPVIAAIAITIFDVYAMKHEQILDKT